VITKKNRTHAKIPEVRAIACQSQTRVSALENGASKLAACCKAAVEGSPPLFSDPCLEVKHKLI